MTSPIIESYEPSLNWPSQFEVKRATHKGIVAWRLAEELWAKAKPIPFQLAAAPSSRNGIGEVEGKSSVRMRHDELNLAFEDADAVEISKENAKWMIFPQF